MSEYIIETEKVSFSYGKTLVLKEVDFNVERGSFIGVLGPNGSGKTTLLRIVLGVIKPSKGKVSLFGQPVEKFNQHHRIGYISQKVVNFDSSFPASVREIVGMGLLAGKKVPRYIQDRDKQKIEQSLADVEMLKYADQRIGELSGGQQQRVFIARALVGSAELLVLDEPTSGVDTSRQAEFYRILKDINLNKQKTIILVSHDISTVTEYATHIAFVNQTLIWHNCTEKCNREEYENMFKGHVHLDPYHG